MAGRERRRFWSDDQKLAILEDVEISGLTVTDVARRHDVLPQQIYTWRRKFSRKPENESRFLPVTLVASDIETSCQASVEEGSTTGRLPAPSIVTMRSSDCARESNARAIVVLPEDAPPEIRMLSLL